MRREISRFKAVSDSGEEYTVIVYQNLINGRSHKHPNDWFPSKMYYLVTTNGLSVNPVGAEGLDAETFHIIETDQIIRKVGQ